MFRIPITIGPVPELHIFVIVVFAYLYKIKNLWQKEKLTAMISFPFLYVTFLQCSLYLNNLVSLNNVTNFNVIVAVNVKTAIVTAVNLLNVIFKAFQ